MTGKVVRVIKDKGFGFIKGDLNGVEYFFHNSEFRGHWLDLLEDIDKKVIKVEFDVVKSQRGPRAENVRRLDWPNNAT
jgi:cold shock CspA family protein